MRFCKTRLKAGVPVRGDLPPCWRSQRGSHRADLEHQNDRVHSPSMLALDDRILYRTGATERLNPLHGM